MDKNTFAPVPPMGWNSYDYYDTTVNEEQVRANADYMARHLKQFGWEYIIVDIQWYARGAGTRRAEFQYIPFSLMETDEYSRLLPDPDRFPSSRDGRGFAPLAEYVHSLGLKFGIHIMRGIYRKAAHLHTAIYGTDATAASIADPSSICPWNPDMYGVLDCPAGQAYYDSLIRLYADWGVDYIKCDDISFTSLYRDHYAGRHEVEMIHRAIEKCGRPIVLSLSPGPALITEAWHYETYANLWRVSDDFWDSWGALLHMFEYCEIWQSHVSPGCYPDCDMLPVGWVGKGFGHERRSNFTQDEARTMMSLWCLFGSPLMIGGELTRMDPETFKLLTNPGILALLDPSRHRRQVRRTAEECVWKSIHADGSIYAAFFNLSDRPAMVSASLEELGADAGARSAHELWEGVDVAVRDGILADQVPSHGCRVFRL